MEKAGILSLAPASGFALSLIAPDSLSIARRAWGAISVSAGRPSLWVEGGYKRASVNILIPVCAASRATIIWAQSREGREE